MHKSTGLTAPLLPPTGIEILYLLQDSRSSTMVFSGAGKVYPHLDPRVDRPI